MNSGSTCGEVVKECEERCESTMRFEPTTCANPDMRHIFDVEARLEYAPEKYFELVQDVEIVKGKKRFEDF